MSDDQLIEINLKPGQRVRSRAADGTGLILNYNKGKTFIDATAKGVWVPPVVEPPVSWTDVPGWRNVFADDFDRTVAKGQFLAGSPDGYHTADGKYLAFKPSWISGGGHFYGDSSIISIGNGMLDEAFYADSSRKAHTATLTCLPTGGTAKGGLLGGRSLITVRADRVDGFKGVPLWWSDLATSNAGLLEHGEIDGPEGSFTAVPSAFMHHTGSTSYSDQDWFPYPPGTSWNDWHDYVTEWMPGQYVRYFIDGVKIGETTTRIPTSPMHFNPQFEGNIGGLQPIAGASGHIQIKRIGLWSPA